MINYALCKSAKNPNTPVGDPLVIVQGEKIGEIIEKTETWLIKEQYCVTPVLIVTENFDMDGVFRIRISCGVSPMGNRIVDRDYYLVRMDVI